MNRIYRIVFNRTLGVPQVVSELAGAPGGTVAGAVDALPKRGLKSGMLAAAVGLALASVALPTWAQTCKPQAILICGLNGGNGLNANITRGGGGAGGAGGAGSISSGAYANSGGAGGFFGNGTPGQGANGSGGSGGTAFTGNGPGAGGSVATQGVGGGGGGGPAWEGYGGGGGGGGGVGSVATNTAFTNPRNIWGGDGGDGGSGGTIGFGSGFGYGGGGGGGGAGVYAASGSSITSNADSRIIGGFGGNGGNGWNAATGGGGGAGVAGTGFALSTAGDIIGGKGGNGDGLRPYYAPYGGGGGLGGVGISGSSLTLTNTGTVFGGTGGKGGNGTVQGGYGGAGGAALSLSQSTLNNAGTISGGQGGAGGTGVRAGAAGVGGVGISGSNLSVINSGTISGGLSGNGVTRAAATTFTGGTNSLELDSGSTITGNVVAVAGGNDTLALGGSSSTGTTFNAANIGSQYLNFKNFLKSGGSTWTLTGTMAAVTPWTISDGILSISSDAGLGDSSGVLTLNGGTLEATASTTSSRAVTLGIARGGISTDSGATLTEAGVISGSGMLTKSGNGVLLLAGNNTYTGGTALTAGTLVLGSESAIGTGTLAMAAGTTLSFSSGFALANAISLSGDPTINVGSGLSSTLSGGISNGTQTGDLVKTGAGTLMLTGTDTYTGSTEVAAGTLDVEGNLVSRVSVDAGAALTGSGSTGDMTIASGALVSPGGNGVRTLTVNGNVSLASGSGYQVNATDSGSSDLIHATGTAALGGGSVIALEAGSNWNVSTKYTILTAGGGVSGTFGGATSNFAFLTPTLSYDANDAYLTLVRNTTAFASVGLTPNQIHTAGATVLESSPSVYNAVLPLAADPAQAAFTTLAGDSLASTRTAMIDDSHYVRDAINNHLQGVQGTGETSQQDDQGSVWVSTWGHGGSHDSDGNATALSSNGSGVLVGTDHDLGTWRLGAVAGSGQLSNNSIGAGADAHSTDTVLGLYTGLDLGAWQWQGGAVHSWYTTHSHRQIDVPGIAGSEKARYDSGVTQAYVDGGYQFTFAQGSLTPYVDLARVWVHQGAINEGGDVAALGVQANGTSVNYGSVGLRGIFEPSAGLQLHANVGYQHAWGDLQPIDQQRFVNGGTDSFTIAGLPVSKNAGIVDLGFRFALSKSVSVDGGCVGQFAKGATDQGARLSLNVTF